MLTAAQGNMFSLKPSLNKRPVDLLTRSLFVCSRLFTPLQSPLSASCGASQARVPLAPSGILVPKLLGMRDIREKSKKSRKDSYKQKQVGSSVMLVSCE